MAASNSLTNRGESVALTAVAAAIATVALSKTAVAEDGTGLTRPSAGTYADQAVSFGAVDTGADPAEIANDAEVSFGDLEADETVTHWAGLDSGGDVVVRGAFAAGVSYQAGVEDPLKFPVGSIVLTMD